jgi:MSHA biogenesis protein MshO
MSGSTPAVRAARATRVTPRRRLAGVTLVELVVAITVMGVLAALGARMLSGPAKTFVQGGDRMILIDTAERALRRMSDEVRASLPNSLRVTQSGAVAWIEFLPASEFGRGRMKAAASGAPGDFLDFENTADDRFDVFGPLPTLYSDSQLVINNLGTTEGDAWTGNNRRAGLSVDSVAGKLIFAPSGAFPSEPPTGRFALIRGPVSFRCEGGIDSQGAGTGTLRRYDGYAIQSSQPVNEAAAPLTGATMHVLATQVSACTVSYDSAMANLGLVTLRIALARGDASAALAVQVAVDNTP